MNNEVLADYRLSVEEQQELLSAQTECTITFLHDSGWPAAVIMSFIVEEGVFWLTTVEGRPQTKGAERDPRVGIVVSSAGSGLDGRRMLSIRGHATIHRDPETKARFYKSFAARMAPDDPEAFVRVLDSAKRVVFEVRPVALLASHDSRKMAGDGRGGKR